MNITTSFINNITNNFTEVSIINYDAALFEFLIKGVFIALVSILGICGNVITMIILSKPQMRSSINCILIGLARCDMVLLITALLTFSLPAMIVYTRYFEYYVDSIYPLIAPISFPIALIAQTGSVYLTLAVTLERYIAVCHPLRARYICTYGRARIFVILIIIFSILYNVPRFLEVNRVEEFDPETNTTMYILKPSNLRRDPNYITIYINWSYLIVMYVIPFSCLAIFNKAIYKQVRKANAERQRLSRLQKKEIGLATMLLCVVIVFFMCNILPLVNNILESFYDELNNELVATSNLLVSINSSVNFIIYVIFGEKFKRLFLKMFCSIDANGQQMTRTACCANGRESPDPTHDDSFVSNGNGRAYSVRNCRHQRSMSNFGGPDANSNRSRTPSSQNTVKIQLTPLCSRTLHPNTDVPCVYYPGNNSNGNILETDECNTKPLCQ